MVSVSQSMVINLKIAVRGVRYRDNKGSGFRVQGLRLVVEG